jgi:hypothetical protein
VFQNLARLAECVGAPENFNTRREAVQLYLRRRGCPIGPAGICGFTDEKNEIVQLRRHTTGNIRYMPAR